MTIHETYLSARLKPCPDTNLCRELTYMAEAASWQASDLNVEALI